VPFWTCTVIKGEATTGVPKTVRGEVSPVFIGTIEAEAMEVTVSVTPRREEKSNTKETTPVVPIFGGKVTFAT
jgi:hypothetical protein